MVHCGGGGLEDDVGELGTSQQPVDPLGRRLETQVPGSAQALAVGIHPDHVPELQVVGPQELVDEIGADVPGSDDGGSRACAHGIDPRHRAGRVHLPVPQGGTDDHGAGAAITSPR